MILFFACALRAVQESESKNLAYIIVMFACGVLLTWMRPYMVVLLFLPGFLLRKKKAAAILTTVLTAALALGGNFFLGHYFTCEYFEPLYDTTAIKMALSGKIIDAARYAKNTVGWVLPGIFDYIGRAFGMGLTAGTQYVVALFSDGSLTSPFVRSSISFILGLSLFYWGGMACAHRPVSADIALTT